ncbi:Nuclease-related domain-containing protein [Lachnospiraceae bacterium]|nr:Nuclease-related domain-containing protein [Lachnospiraceae bacterium]
MSILDHIFLEFDDDYESLKSIRIGNDPLDSFEVLRNNTNATQKSINTSANVTKKSFDKDKTFEELLQDDMYDGDYWPFKDEGESGYNGPYQRNSSDDSDYWPFKDEDESGYNGPYQRNSSDDSDYWPFKDEGESDYNSPYQKNPSDDSVRKGESEVDYQLRWLGPDYLTIERKSQKYDKNCILIKNKEFIDEAQEFDHIVISDKAVYLIETKSYFGKILINSNGNWILNSALANSKTVESPESQVFRHHQVIKSILGEEINDNDIVDIICISHQDAVVEGESNCRIPVVKYDTLCNYIQSINKSKTSTYDKNKLKNLIENYIIV